MASSKQAEYNRLRAELDKLRRENFGASQEVFGSRHDAYVKKVKALEAQLKVISPGSSDVLFLDKAILDAEESVRVAKKGTPAYVAALAKLKSLSDTATAQNAQQDADEAFDAGYKKSVKDAKEAKKALKDRSDAAKKKADETAKWETDNDISIGSGRGPVAKPESLKDKAEPIVVVKGNPKLDIKSFESEVGWAGQVFMGGSDRQTAKYAGSRLVTSTTPNRLLVQEATGLYVNDPKVQKKVLSILQNAGVEVDNIMAYQYWGNAVIKAEELSKGGKGLVVTPFEVLQSLYGTSKGPTTTSNKSIVEYTSKYMGAVVDKMFQETLGKDPTPAQRSRYVTEFQALAAQGNVATTTTNGRNSTTKTKYGFRESDEALKLAGKLEKSPEYATDYKQKQALDFDDAFSRIVAGGL